VDPGRFSEIRRCWKRRRTQNLVITKSAPAASPSAIQCGYGI
jgi:hypothetical protein